MDLTVFPNMYIILTGPPATRKGTAMEPVERFLSELQVKIAASKTSPEALIKALTEATDVDMDYQTSRFTSHSSLTIIGKELTVFIGYDNKGMLANLCDWFDCGPDWKYDTIGRGESKIQGVWVNLLGGTTPRLLRESLPAEAIGGGFTSRTIFVCEEKKGKMVVFPTMPHEMGINLIADLAQIKSMRGTFRYTPDFVDIYTDWRVKWDEVPAIKDPTFIHYNDRRPIHVLKLGMIMSASRGDDMIVTGDDLQRAIDILEATEKNMPKAFGGLGSAKSADVLYRVSQTIALDGTILFKNLLDMYKYDVNSAQELSVIVATLEKAGYCKVEYAKENTKIHYIRPVE